MYKCTVGLVCVCGCVNIRAAGFCVCDIGYQEHQRKLLVSLLSISHLFKIYFEFKVNGILKHEVQKKSIWLTNLKNGLKRR